MIDLKVKLVSETAKMPKRANSTDACADLYADLKSEGLDEVLIQPGETRKISVGIATEIPEGYYASIFPRSGLSIKEGLVLANLTGIVDCKYRDPWIVALRNQSNSPKIVQHGDRIAQFNILPVLDVDMIQVDELNLEGDRGGGIGHTGKKRF